jgi:hypothetical protein
VQHVLPQLIDFLLTLSSCRSSESCPSSADINLTRKMQCDVKADYFQKGVLTCGRFSESFLYRFIQTCRLRQFTLACTVMSMLTNFGIKLSPVPASGAPAQGARQRATAPMRPLSFGESLSQCARDTDGDRSSFAQLPQSPEPVRQGWPEAELPPTCWTATATTTPPAFPPQLQL